MDDLINKKNGAFFSALMFHWIHEDQIIWGHTKTLIAIQAGVIGGAYSIHEKSGTAAIVLLGLGMLLTVVLLLIMRHNKQTRDLNVKLINKIGEELALYPYPLSRQKIGLFKIDSPPSITAVGTKGARRATEVPTATPCTVAGVR